MFSLSHHTRRRASANRRTAPSS